MKEAVSYGFQDFVTDLEMITQVETDQAEIIRKISRKVKILISNGEFLTEEECQSEPDHYARHLVYVDRKRRFVIMSGVWRPGQGTPVHDHGTWGVMGIYRGELHVTNYLRVDDQTKPGYAELRESTAVWSGPGTVTYVLPPNEEIHKVENESDQETLSLHVYGKDIIEYQMYDVGKKAVVPYGVDYENAGKSR